MLPYQAGITFTQMLGVCVLCRYAPMTVGFLCQDCDNQIEWLPPAFEVADITIQATTFYTGAMARAIGAFKDKERLDTLPFLVHSLSKVGELLTDLDDAMILPIPTTTNRLRERGFYPVGVLAHFLSAMTNLPLYQGLSRPIDGTRQRHLGRQERLENLTGAFVVNHLPICETLILFDDVATTGATFAEVADTLWQDNPDLTIYGVCLAHGSPD